MFCRPVLLLCALSTLPRIALAQEQVPGPPPQPDPYGYYSRRPPRLPPEQRPGYHKHDGLYLSSYLGLGYLRVSDGAGSGARLTGVARQFQLALGFAVTENVLVFGELIGMDADSQTYMPVAGNADRRLDNAALYGLGVGVAYHLMPVNIFIAASLAAMKIGFDVDYGSGAVVTDVGLGGCLRVGKEWWVSGDWALGASLQAIFARASESTEMSSLFSRGAGNWTGSAFSAAFSVTYN